MPELERIVKARGYGMANEDGELCVETEGSQNYCELDCCSSSEALKRILARASSWVLAAGCVPFIFRAKR
jgi:hypothetical protein